MGRIAGRIGTRCVSIPETGSLGELSMKKLAYNLAEPQKGALAQKLFLVNEIVVHNKDFASSASVSELFARAATLTSKAEMLQTRPASIMFLRKTNGNFEIGKSFLSDLSLPEAAISGEDSPVLFSQKRNLVIYVPDVLRPEATLCNPRDLLSGNADSSFYAISLKESGIKIPPALRSRFKSFIVAPIYSAKEPKNLGVAVMGWERANPLDPLVDIETIGTIMNHLSFTIPFILKK